MTATALGADDASLYEALKGIPNLGVPANWHAVLPAGRRIRSILREIVALHSGRGEALAPRAFLLPGLGSCTRARGETAVRGQTGTASRGRRLQRPSLVWRRCRQAAVSDRHEGAWLPASELLAVIQGGR